MNKKDLVQPAIRMGMRQNDELLKKLAKKEDQYGTKRNSNR